MQIRSANFDDFPQWLTLWNANNQGHKDEAITTQTWTRILDADSDVYALLAVDNNELIGLLHYILHPTTGSLTPVCYMQDVFVMPDHREKGIARALITQLHKIGQNEDWNRIYWLAENQNQAAQNLYKTLGQKLDFALHVLPLK